MNKNTRSGSIRDSLGELTLDIRENVLFSSLLVGFALMVTLSSKRFQQLPVDEIRSPLLDSIANILDVGVIQAATAGLVFVHLCRYMSHIVSRHSRAVLVGSLSFALVVLTLLSTVIQAFFLKPSFRYGAGLVHPHLPRSCAFIKGLPLGELEKYSAPSSFVFQQTLILLAFLLLSHQQRWREVVSRLHHRVLHWVLYAALLIVAALRVYNGRHTLFDIGVAIGTAVMLFWCFVLCWARLIKPTHLHDDYLKEAMIPLAGYGVAILFYCQETSWWLWVLFALFLTFAALTLLIPKGDEGAVC